ncbi:MAG: hypothetical protein NXI19_03195 [Alphaproteobacteria bacterium]|nr:hypothetical protein [Alphaproteobacteria bacterium]
MTLLQTTVFGLRQLRIALMLGGSALLTVLLAGTPTAAVADDVLLMMEQAGCHWCEIWNEEIGVVYGLTEEGKRAPLRRVEMSDPMPNDVTVRGQTHFTPTFILLRDGAEVGRIEGYPGEDFFWPMLNQLLNTPPQHPGREAPKG